MERVYLTRDGYEKLMQELEHLKNVKRREIAAATEHARQLGDLKENAEYAAAKEAMSYNEKRIHELEDKLSRAEIIDNSKSALDAVCVGVKVKLSDLDSGEEIEYSLVGPDEANPVEGLISIVSPVGKALLGHKVDEVVEIAIPAGILKYKIVAITC
ncbi:MAG: transcription elongation factor GreA [Candidatus Omnitrophota bacterium]|nr:transcription elongation factor GreA [Candidatus Omnitrophota bacterium]